jgi:hypothetical protein
VEDFQFPNRQKNLKHHPFSILPSFSTLFVLDHTGCCCYLAGLIVVCRVIVWLMVGGGARRRGFLPRPATKMRMTPVSAVGTVLSVNSRLSTYHRLDTWAVINSSAELCNYTVLVLLWNVGFTVGTPDFVAGNSMIIKEKSYFCAITLH